MKIRTYFLVHFTLFIFTVFISLYFGSLYTKGDQYFYNMWFEEISSLNLYYGYSYYASQINYFEFIHFLVTWYGSLVFDKLTLHMFVNVLFILLLVEVFKKLNFNPLLALIIIASNFYVPVLLLAAERLKFGFMFLFLFVLFDAYNKKIYMVVLTLAGHLQFLILWVSIFFGLSIKQIFSNKIPNRIIKYFIVMLVLGSYFIFISTDHLLYKFLQYQKLGGVSNIVKPVFFMFLSLYCCYHKKLLILGIFVALSVASFIIGNERITIFSYTVFLYFSSYRNKGVNAPNIFLIIYYGVKSTIFYSNIINTNSGF